MGYVESLLADNEQIIVRTRQHWMTLAQSLLVNGVLLILIFVIALVAISVLNVFGLLITLLFILPVAAFVRDYLKWWYEEYIVTNRRVIQTEGIINKHVIDSSLEKVNDVVLSQSWLGRMFDYGNIEILTASEMGVNLLHNISSPIKFKTEMLNQKENFANERQPSAPTIPELIAGLDQLRKQGILTEEEFQRKKNELLARLQ
jgi:uncharacterized membrane protein YdbT with pleckstrin-like domain